MVIGRWGAGPKRNSRARARAGRRGRAQRYVRRPMQMVREANENGKSEANEKEKNEQREQCGLETSLGLNSKSSRWPLHLVREANEKNEKSEKNKKNEKHLSLGHHENLDEEYLMCQTGRRPQCEFRDDKTISGCLLGSRRRHQWTQRIRTRIRLESDAAKTTTAWESSQCVYARKSLRGAPLFYFKFTGRQLISTTPALGRPPRRRSSSQQAPSAKKRS